MVANSFISHEGHEHYNVALTICERMAWLSYEQTCAVICAYFANV